MLVRQGVQTVQCAKVTGRERSVSLTCVQCARTARISGNEPSPARKRHFASAYDAKAKVMNVFFYIHSYSRKILEYNRTYSFFYIHIFLLLIFF